MFYCEVVHSAPYATTWPVYRITQRRPIGPPFSQGGIVSFKHANDGIGCSRQYGAMYIA